MNTFKHIAAYELQNLSRSKWLLAYFLFFGAINYSFLQLTADSNKALVTMMNLSLLIVPLVSILFGSIYIYNAREFMELMLCQPIPRSVLLLGLFAGISVPLSIVYSAGILIPFLLFNPPALADTSFLLLLGLGIIQHFIFTSAAFAVTISIDDRAKGLGVLLMLWLGLSFVYDGVVLAGIFFYQDYPLTGVVIGAMLLNPIDLARVLFTLQFDAAAMMGFTGAVFKNFLGGTAGSILCIASLGAWTAVPLTIALRRFNKKDF